MKRLFFKIFLWFWLGMVVMGVALVTVAALTQSRSAEDQRWIQKYELPLQLRSRHEVELIEHHGTAAAAQYVDSLEQRDPIKNFLLDDAGNEVLGHHVPANVLGLVPRVDRTQPAVPLFLSRDRIMAEKVIGPSGRPYSFFMQFPPRPFFPHSLVLFFFEDVGAAGILRPIALLATAALFCLWLARHITDPIGKLRWAASEIANQHLEARVGDDVTGRQDELADLGRDFNRMAERIGALVGAQRDLLADVSHELRSPLTRLNLALGLARQRANPENLQHLDRMERETERLNNLIGQLLSLARIESGVDLQQRKVFELGALVQEVASDGDYEARSRNCRVKFDQNFDCYVNGAREMLRGAVENVVRNAVRHTDEGSAVEVAMERRGNGSGAYAVIKVRDHGPGVPESKLADLFIPFHRISEGIHKNPGGAGLGLAIAERTFRLHGGCVNAANTAGGGLTVAMQLPAFETPPVAGIPAK